MARKNLIRQSIFPYHVSSRSNNQDWFSIPLEEVWQISMSSFKFAQSHYPIQLHSFVLMSNHYHMILSTPDENIDSFMQVFNKFMSEKLKLASERINRMFGGPYKWSIIDNQTYLYNVFRYVYQNPLRAQMVTQCEHYPYSTLFIELNKLNFPMAISPLIGPTKDLIEWYNLPLSHLQIGGLRRGLKKAYLDIRPERDSKVSPKFENPFI